MTNQHATPAASSHAARPTDLEGDLHQIGRPEWRPLLELVGDLSGEFMWMSEISLANGGRLHAYKHCATRRYLHLSLTGDAYAYVASGPAGDPGRYRPISRDEALREAFTRWHDLTEGSPDYQEQSEALELAFEQARRGERFPVEVDWLDRQRSYEEAVERARDDERRSDPRYRGGATVPGADFVGDLDLTEAGF